MCSLLSGSINLSKANFQKLINITTSSIVLLVVENCWWGFEKSKIKKDIMSIITLVAINAPARGRFRVIFDKVGSPCGPE